MMALPHNRLRRASTNLRLLFNVLSRIQGLMDRHPSVCGAINVQPLARASCFVTHHFFTTDRFVCPMVPAGNGYLEFHVNPEHNWMSMLVVRGIRDQIVDVGVYMSDPIAIVVSGGANDRELGRMALDFVVDNVEEVATKAVKNTYMATLVALSMAEGVTTVLQHDLVQFLASLEAIYREFFGRELWLSDVELELVELSVDLHNSVDSLCDGLRSWLARGGETLERRGDYVVYKSRYTDSDAGYVEITRDGKPVALLHIDEHNCSVKVYAEKPEEVRDAKKLLQEVVTSTHMT